MGKTLCGVYVYFCIYTWALSGTNDPFLTGFRAFGFLGEPASDIASYITRVGESMPLLTEIRGLAWSGARPKLKPSLRKCVQVHSY